MFKEDDEPGFWYTLKYGIPWMEIILVLGLVAAIVTATLDYFSSTKGTDYVGMLSTQNGFDVVCEKVSWRGHCTKWDQAGIDTSLDVADFFGPNTFGVAKGEMPRIPDDAPFAPILNVWASWTFSVAVSMNLSFFVASLILISFFGLATVFLVALVTKAMTPSLAVAIVALPAYTSFLSMATLSGSAIMVGCLHVLFIPGVFILILVNLLKGSRFRRRRSVKSDSNGNTSVDDWTDFQF